MSKPHVLISGASIAGPALAYWLQRAGCKTTVVERSRLLRSTGQGVDIRDTARDILKAMGIFELAKERSSKEQGIQVVDGRNGVLAKFPVDLDSGKGDSLTSDIEILRGELAGILFDLTKGDTEYVFGEMVKGYVEKGNGKVEVSFVNGREDHEFDLVVAADGLGSKIRGMMFGGPEGVQSDHVKSLNSYVSYFSLPKGKTDSMWSRVHWAAAGRTMVLRPDNVGRTRVFLSTVAYEATDERLGRYRKAAKEDIAAQKALVQDLFQDATWESDRILEGMQVSDDFYMQHVAQVRLERWSKGRVALVGDAGFAPSPFTGMGTSLAFIGAYVLAGEITKNPNDIPAALESYERILKPYVESIQKLPPGIPWIVNPQSALGVRVLETLAKCSWWASWAGVGTLLSKIAEYIPFGGDNFKLPEYEAFATKVKG